MTGCYVNTFLSPLSLERETECLKKVAQNDKEAKDELILHNMRLVAHVTKKYAVSEDEMEELISIGTIGLIKAVSSFKADYGNRFATFAISFSSSCLLIDSGSFVSFSSAFSAAFEIEIRSRTAFFIVVGVMLCSMLYSF